MVLASRRHAPNSECALNSDVRPITRFYVTLLPCMLSNRDEVNWNMFIRRPGCCSSANCGSQWNEGYFRNAIILYGSMSDTATLFWSPWKLGFTFELTGTIIITNNMIKIIMFSFFLQPDFHRFHISTAEYWLMLLLYIGAWNSLASLSL